jgi:hypothetical protein
VHTHAISGSHCRLRVADVAKVDETKAGRLTRHPDACDVFVFCFCFCLVLF